MKLLALLSILLATSLPALAEQTVLYSDYEKLRKQKNLMKVLSKLSRKKHLNNNLYKIGAEFANMGAGLVFCIKN